ncbi:MAG: tyrosine--tRNA ligase, partial [Chitinophagaceae bacterium]
NITTGAELVRRRAGGEAFAFTCPLITKSDGGKFGKTEKGNVWLDASLTTPYQFYQFWLNASDEDAEKWIKIFTFLGKEEIESILQQHRKDAGQRLLQKRLAEEISILIHGKEELEKAVETTHKLFHDLSAPAETLSIEDLEAMEGVIKSEYAKDKIGMGIDVISLLTDTHIFQSKGEARKMVQGGGVSVNRKKVDDLKMTVDNSLLLHDKYVLVQKGKKNYYLIKMV